MRKGLLKVEGRRPGKMMLLHVINDIIIISRSSYSGVYQDEAKIRALQRDKYFLLKELKTSGTHFAGNSGFFIIPLHF